jgi:hypothetical protein
MGDLALAQEAAPSSVTAGQVVIYVDTNGNVRAKTSAGADFALAGLFNQSTTAQSPAAATRTYIAGSNILVPPTKLQVGTRFNWTLNLTKTAAGTAASTFDICVGTTGTTADTARLSFTKPAGTAAVDEGTIEIDCYVRSIGASGVMVGQFTMSHNGNTVGHMTIPVACVDIVSSGFDMTVANLIVGLCITSGASDAVTLQFVSAEAWNI